MTDLKYTDVMKPKDLSIAHLWTHFAFMVLPINAPKSQREEMRKAFYAGFVECFKIVVDMSTELPEAEAAKVLDRLRKESHEFFESFTRQQP